MTNTEKIFQKYGLKKTLFRTELLDLFMKSVSSVSFEEIKQKVSTTSDKETIDNETSDNELNKNN